MSETLRYTAFTTEPEGGNPAGVVLEAAGLSDAGMQKRAAEVGYSETAFVTAVDRSGPVPRLTMRYFSPAVEVEFCGHATIATGVAWAERQGPGRLLCDTAAGPVDLEVARDADGLRAALTSVPTRVHPIADDRLDQILSALGWSRRDLDPSLPPRVAFGGVLHPVLGVRTRKRLARLEYDFDRLHRLMKAENWITLQLVYRESSERYHARDPFPVGGVVEDPATGAAAAAFGGYLLELGLAAPGSRLVIIQGEDMGRKSTLHVDLPPEGRRIRVSGHARLLP
ncbi:MAG: PhzF family phenazine biosynthesis protein [Holophagales bacterium]|nr:PhzF family phenazine biosynthesis protein [Holophagales bacterium]